MTTDFVVAIPARYAASRLPGKPLRLLGGECRRGGDRDSQNCECAHIESALSSGHHGASLVL